MYIQFTYISVAKTKIRIDTATFIDNDSFKLYKKNVKRFVAKL